MTYCKACQRETQFKRHFGVGTLLLVIFTGGLGLLLLPLMQPTCPICGQTRGDNWEAGGSVAGDLLAIAGMYVGRGWRWMTRDKLVGQ